MNKILVAIFVSLLMTGTGVQSQPPVKNKLFNAIDWDDEETRSRIITEAMNGSKLQEGKEKGESLFYFLEEQTPYTGWVRHEISDAIGGLVRLVRFKGGKNQGLVIFRKNGKKLRKLRMDNYKDGKVATVVVWKPNGEKCPITNVKGGNGVEAEYFEKQTEPNRFCWAFIYMDGKKISWRPRQVS